VIPYMMFWGFFGYNFFFGKKKKRDYDDRDERG
jgi:hypothetical protein